MKYDRVKAWYGGGASGRTGRRKLIQSLRRRAKKRLRYLNLSQTTRENQDATVN